LSGSLGIPGNRSGQRTDHAVVSATIPGPLGGARAAPITNEFATTTGRDGNNPRRMRAALPHSPDKPEAPTQRISRSHQLSRRPALLSPGDRPDRAGPGDRLRGVRARPVSGRGRLLSDCANATGFGEQEGSEPLGSEICNAVGPVLTDHADRLASRAAAGRASVARVRVPRRPGSRSVPWSPCRGGG
jgi:hypothetical protein